MFDFYENKVSNEIKIGYRFLYQSEVKTLTDDDIDREIKDIINQILTIESVSIPGLK
jgi:phenylalanyl-tRNA synthetase beta subunit